MPARAGIVLAGGAARRMSGVDKALLRSDGTTLLDRAVRALGKADPVVVVGPPRPGFTGVRWTREREPGTGPVAALAAGLAALEDTGGDRLVVLLAADLAAVTLSTVDRLERAVLESGVDGAVLADEQGVAQWLIGAWRYRALAGAVPAEPENASLRVTLGRLRITLVPAEPGEAQDIDTPADLDRLS